MKQLLIFLILSSSFLYSQNYSEKLQVKRFIQKMHKNFNYKSDYLRQLFRDVRKNPYIKRKVSSKSLKNKSKKKSPKTTFVKQGPWDKYLQENTEQNRSQLGAEFITEHKGTLGKVYKKYGVPPAYIAAIIGIESYYGKNRGRYYVFDQLTHLAFDKGKRNSFYKRELQEFLRLCYRQGIEPRGIKGSASGAIGLAQFLPSNYEKIAVDFNNDGRKEMNNYEDAIASIAHYFQLSGWQKKEPVATRVTYKGNRFYGLKTGSRYKYKRKYLPNIYPIEPFDYDKEVHLIKLERAKYDELWYGTKNFYALTRYNHSSYYAMAVHLLAEKIKDEYRIALYEKRKEEYLVFN